MGVEPLSTSGIHSGFDLFAKRKQASSTPETSVGVEYKLYKSSLISSNIIRSIYGSALNNKADRALLVTPSRLTTEARVLAKNIEPIAIEIMDYEEIKNWWGSITVDTDIRKLMAHEIINVVNREFAYRVAKNPRELLNLDWREVERMMAEIFQGLGFKTELTPSSKDGGKDIILKMNKHGEVITCFVEIKHWRSEKRVGESYVKDFINVVVNEGNVAKGLFLSTSGFSHNLMESLTEIQRDTVKIGDKNKVVSLCQTYIKMDAGIWSPQNPLPELLFDGTL